MPATILQTIMQTKAQEIAHSKTQISLSNLQTQAQIYLQNSANMYRDFYQAIYQKAVHKNNTIIAEIKKASPSKGVLRQDFCVQTIAKAYQQAGAACLSVLTDEQYFQGHLDYLKQAKLACDLPILRKDFIIDEYQIYESIIAGADAILLIVDCLSAQQLQDYYELALSLKLSVLVEVHHLDELAKINFKPQLLGVNNRNLHTFEVDVMQTLNVQAHAGQYLSTQFNQSIWVAESGIDSLQTMQIMNQANIYTFLMGEYFMKNDIHQAMQALNP